jgi:uncharacterized NAD-dependent epimerase/dehydratase family protein
MNALPSSPDSPPGSLPQPYLLFLGDITEPGYAKTAFGLRDWAPDRCVGEWSCGATVSTGLPTLTPKEAFARGARGLVIGVANAGGLIPDSWLASLVEALEAGLDLVGGMHTRLADIFSLSTAATRLGRRLIDIRTPPPDISIASGRKRTGKRVLTVGTDCALGKKYTALALANAMIARGVNADFRATGQTGILIAGSGIPLDAVIADFEAGAAEMLSPVAATDHWDVIEGQGSLFHPAYAGVSLGLLHGSQPDVFVVCQAPGRTHVLGHPEFMLPTIEEVIDMTIRLGRRTNPLIRCAGVSMNTGSLESGVALELLANESQRLGLPVTDPIRGGGGFHKLIDAVLSDGGDS